MTKELFFVLLLVFTATSNKGVDVSELFNPT